MALKCASCQSDLSGRQTKYCSKKCKTDVLIYKRRADFKIENGCSVQTYKGIKNKMIIVNRLGGGCSICGYNKNLAALSFHHLDPLKKSFQIDLRSLSNRSMNSLLSEIDKCSLVCINCHIEIHNPDFDISKINSSNLFSSDCPLV